MKDFKYHIITFGCQMNHSDSERMAGVFGKLGMNVTDKEHDADVVVINACSVRQKAIDRIWGKLKEFDAVRKSRPERPLYTVLTGCVLPADRPKFAEKFDLYFPMKDLPTLPKKITDAIAQEGAGMVRPKKIHIKKAELPSVDELRSDAQILYTHSENGASSVASQTPLNPISQVPGSEEHYLQIKPTYQEKFTAFVPIMTGCNAFCTYCAVPFTRGREVSRKPEEIISEVEQLILNNYKEVTLLGQIINKYMVSVDDTFIKFLEWTLSKHGSSIDALPELQDEDLRTHKLFKFHHLLAVINEFNGDFWLRFTSSHPKWFSDTLINTIARCDKIPNHMHLPVQAGSDAVLRRMLRPYTIEEYKQIVTQIREKIPDVSITTDLIVGFCGETDHEYAQSEDLFKWVQYDMAYIAQYSPRPGTKAEQNMNDDVPKEAKKYRELALNTILEQTAHEQNKKYIGKQVRVLVDTCQEKTDQFICSGKTGTFKSVRFNASKDLKGTFVNVKISEARPWSLLGEISNNQYEQS